MLLGLLVVASALFGMQTSRGLHESRERQAITAAMLIAPQGAVLLAQGRDDALREWVRQVRTNPAVRLVAVQDETGQVRAIEARTASLARQVIRPDSKADTPPAPATWHGTDADGAEVYGTTVPIPLLPHKNATGRLTLGLAASSLEPPSGPGIWGFSAPLAIAAVVIWAIGGRSLVRRIAEPLVGLARYGGSRALDSSREGDDAIHAIVKEFDALKAEADHWHQRARTLEHTLEQRVASQTRGYQTELRRAVRAAEVDPLSGLNNRRSLERCLDPVVADHLARQGDLSMIMVDVDHFKALNDTLGHSAGDRLISFMGELLGTSVREGDMAFRLGGDEFLLLLPNTTEAQAADIAQRLAALFAQHVRTLPPVRPSLSLSTGVASLSRSGGPRGQDLLRAADSALYRAKAGGRAHAVPSGTGAPDRS
jgi:diguanylate cyclase (GGDEF)-like protein